MAWSNIANFLERFRNLKPPERFIKEEAAKIIEANIGLSVEPENIICRGGVLLIKSASPSVKNEIFIKKQAILRDLNKKLGPKSPKEIRFS